MNGVNGISLNTGIYVFGKLMLFGVGGKCMGEVPMTYFNNRIREIDLISILNVENILEVAYILNEEMKQSDVTSNIYDILEWCTNNNNLAFVGRRELCIDGVEGTQYIYGFEKGMLFEREIQGVFCGG